jgi:sialate O-acetylesterase
MGNRSSTIAALLLVSLGPFLARAEVRLPKLLSSHMVLQRDSPIHLWGWSEPGERISVTLGAEIQDTTGNSLGQWSAYLPPQPSGGPFQITISGSNKIVLEDVLIGDVWFASGQSNMEMPLRGFPGSAVIKNGAQEIAAANYPSIRLLLVTNKASSYPLEDVGTEQSWTVCAPATAANFSAVAYFFGRDLSAREHVPIGLIDSSWGGTPAEAWMSLEGISSDASLMPVFAARAQMAKEQTHMEAMLAAEKRADDLARSRNLPAPEHPWRPDFSSWAPSWLFNGMVAPFTSFPIKGVIWYQGESNASSELVPLYAKLFPALIGDWRSHWQQGDFPFLFVQIANYNAGPSDNWPLVREAQRRTLSLASTGMAVTVDIGDPNNIHPPDKQSVGERLALAAQALAYHEHVEYCGPTFRQISIENAEVRVWFDHAEGLTTKGADPQGFELAGADHRFLKATARIVGPSVIVTNTQIERPQFVRYAWSNAPVVNLFNSAGLPASPFTSELSLTSPN